MRKLMTRPLVATAIFLLIACGTAIASDAPSAKDHLVVAADGSGDFKTVQAAVDAVPSHNDKRVTIEIKPGTYKERLTIPKDKPMISFIGTDASKTILTFSNTHATPGPNGKELGTSKSASTFVYGDDFQAENVTFENDAGPVGQAVAINLYGDRLVFRKCRFVGWQDTLYTNQKREYYEDCYISGHVDYVFGAATAYFQNCELHCRRQGSITAASTPKDSPYGYVFSHCKITSEAPPASVILGRPWRPYSSVTFLYTEMANCIKPAGWDNWQNPANEKTARYAEYASTGPGAKPGDRVKWAKQLTEAEAKEITVEKVLGGSDHWNPQADASGGASH